MGKLTKAQLQALMYVARRPKGVHSSQFWSFAHHMTGLAVLNRRLCEVVNVLADGEDYELVRITPAGRSALKEASDNE